MSQYWQRRRFSLLTPLLSTSARLNTLIRWGSISISWRKQSETVKRWRDEKVNWRSNTGCLKWWRWSGVSICICGCHITYLPPFPALLLYYKYHNRSPTDVSHTTAKYNYVKHLLYSVFLEKWNESYCSLGKRIDILSPTIPFLFSCHLCVNS